MNPYRCSANQDVSGFCEVQNLTVKVIQFVLSKYFNIVILEPFYKNRQFLVTLINNLLEARSFFINFPDCSDDIFSWKTARLWITDPATQVLLSGNPEIDDLGSVSLS
jgi:hypothetical protein